MFLDKSRAESSGVELINLKSWQSTGSAQTTPELLNSSVAMTSQSGSQISKRRRSECAEIEPLWFIQSIAKLQRDASNRCDKIFEAAVANRSMEKKSLYLLKDQCKCRLLATGRQLLALSSRLGSDRIDSLRTDGSQPAKGSLYKYLRNRL